jgi:GH25 family lysozyme M1 (1,4-beta-N-acetylmuramidase)
MRKLTITLLALFLVLPISVNASTYSDYSNKEYEQNKKFESSIIVNGVDVSGYQSTKSDWNKAKASGIDFAIIRLTFTRSTSGKMEVDENFISHYKKAGEAGMMRGIYVFSQAKNKEEGIEEANFALKTLKDFDIRPEDLDLPIYMDYEFYHKEESRLNDLTSTDAIEAAKAFCETIKSNGYKAGVYANTTFFESYLDDGKSLDKDINLWVAQYSSENESAADYSIWQYSSSAIIPGIYADASKSTKDVDVDFWYIDTSLNKDSEIKIFGNTNVEHTGKPVLPSLEIYDGSKKA